MRLTDYTDYALRVLMYCAANPTRLVTVGEVAQFHRISRSHLTKIVNKLAREQIIETVRGRRGGVRLSRSPSQIRIGDVIRTTEPDFQMVECFSLAGDGCALMPNCHIRSTLRQALDAYFAVLDRVSLADMMTPAAGAGAGARVEVVQPRVN